MLTPSVILGGSKLPRLRLRLRLNRNQIIKIIGIFSFVLVLVNSYFLLKPDSKIERAYYFNEYEGQVKKNYQHFVTKKSVVASKEVIYITADASELDQVKVKKGQIIYVNDSLAVYNEVAREQLVRQTEVELNAYNSELYGLEDALKEVERQAADRKPTSYINADQIAENISVEVQMEIAQNHTSSGASAILMQHIAEAERKIEITQATLDNLNETKSITSPMNGSIGDIVYSDGSVTFEIHSSEKNIIAYLTEEQWREIKTGQSVMVEVQGHDEPIAGVVVETQEFPAQQSVWLQRLIQEGAVQQDQIVYEIRIDVNDVLLLAPFNSLAKADITIQEINDSYITPSNWIVEKEVEGVSNQHIYTVDYDGKIRLQPITVLHEAPSNRWDILTEKLATEGGGEGEDAIAQRQLKHVQSHLQNTDDEHQSITAFTMNSYDPSILLNSKEKRIQAASFPPLPLRIISFDEIGKVTWKDVVKYLFY